MPRRICQHNMRHAIADAQFPARIVQHDIEKLQCTAQGALQRARMEHRMAKQIETSRPHGPRGKAEKLIIDGLGNEPPEPAILHIGNGFAHLLRQARRRHQGRGVEAALAHALQRILNKARRDIMSFHGILIL